MSSTENKIKPLIEAFNQIFDPTNDRRIKLFLHIIKREIEEKDKKDENIKNIVDKMTQHVFTTDTPLYMQVKNYELKYQNLI